MNPAAAIVCSGPPGPNGQQQHWRFPPWMVWGAPQRGRGPHHQNRHYRDFVMPPFIRRVPVQVAASQTATAEFKICECPIVCYFSMAVSLILIGCLTTVFVLDDTFGHFSSMVSQLWLVGPLFISCGVVIFVRTVIFVRRKQNIRRQRAELRRRRRTTRRGPSEAGFPADVDLEAGCSRRDSFSSLPPDYEAVINGVRPPDSNGGQFIRRSSCSSSRRVSRGHRPSLACLNLETPPPSYDDVIRVPHCAVGPLRLDHEHSNGPISIMQTDGRRFSLNIRVDPKDLKARPLG